MPNKIDIYLKANKEMLEVLEIEKKLSSKQKPSENLKQMRQNYNKSREYWNKGGKKPRKIINKTIKGKFGDFRVRFIYPKTQSSNKCCIFIHGGGFIVGNPKTHDKLTRNFAHEAKCPVAVIDYHLSPEFKFPSAIYECVKLIKYIQKNADKLGLDKKCICFAGDSAGANIALGTTLFIRDKKIDIHVKSLILYYGVYGLRDSISKRLLGGEYDGCSSKDMKYYEKMYLKRKKDAKSVYYDCLSADLSYGLPPVYMAVGDLDPLQDDSKVLKLILDKYNSTCKLEIYKGVIHAFLHYSKILPEAKKALKSGAGFLRKAIK